jgi:hypothetical protein
MPELYEVVGSILRDIAQARAVSDLYSREVSRFYETDPVLRNFPVPRAEISEASFTVMFAIRDVTIDENRQDARNARVSQVFEKYAADTVRAALMQLRALTTKLKADSNTSPDDKAALTSFENSFLSEDYRNLLRARLMRYLQDNLEKLIEKGDGHFKTEEAEKDIKEFIENLRNDPVMAQAIRRFPEQLQPGEADLLQTINKQLSAMNPELQEALQGPPDFRIDVDVKPELVNAAQNAVCSISVKSTIRNYVWAKVDDDPQSIHSIRTLHPE